MALFERSESSNFKHTYDKEQLQFINEIYEKFPKDVLKDSYLHGKELNVEQIFYVKDSLYKIEGAIKMVTDKLRCLFTPLNTKRETIPPFVFKEGEKHNHLKELFINKLLLRKCYFDLYAIVQPIRMIEMNDSLKMKCI